MTTRYCLTFILLLVVLLVGPAGLAAAPASAALGQILSQDARIDGFKVPSGSTLMSSSLIHTEGHPATIHLIQGGVLELSRNSSAYIESISKSQVKVTVRSGTLTFRSETGQIVRVTPGAELVFSSSRIDTNNLVQGALALLTTSAAAGQQVLKVNDATGIDFKRQIRITDPSNQFIEEAHCAKFIDTTTIKVTPPLDNPFDPQSLILQRGVTKTSSETALEEKQEALCQRFSPVGPFFVVGPGLTGLLLLTEDDETKIASPSVPE